ncbi:hypothetical protein QAD02_003493 [Eretmocerus hayati]|uniref:Uncharacterized protein n=1 Tax=Eretmocerus hayati TaxID=131215 RepID=A0ACC2NLW4_9HYME|nr:hypothetical protein QAD02_003493 [Eretmocerus hayati]
MKLYDSCRVNQRQSEAMHLAKALRFHNCDKDFEASVKCTNLHLPYEVRAYESLYLLNQSLPKPNITVYYYCLPCEKFIDFGSLTVAVCKGCNVQYDQRILKKKQQYFINVSLREQLIRFLASETSQHLRKECNESDIVNSAVYKEKRRTGVIAVDDLSLKGFADGVKPYNNTQDQLWPLAVAINELPYRLRKNNILLCGVWIEVGKGHARVFLGGVITPRTQAMHLEHLRKVVETGNIQKGVIGPTVLMLLRAVNIVLSFVPEYMHCGPLGVIKSFTEAWFLPKYKGKPFYLGRKKRKEFNRRMTNIKPTSEITRLPKEYGEDPKASQMKNIALYYSLPCLRGLMGQEYYDHWFLFVYGFTLCLEDHVSDDDRRRAKKAFEELRDKIEDLYGKEHKRFNAHMFEHIIEYVELFGALWAWSAFPFEHFNGVLTKCYHGTQHVPEQIAKISDRLAHLKNEAHIFNSPDCDPKVTKYFLELTTDCNITQIIEHGNDLRICTPGKKCVSSPSQKRAVEDLINGSISDECDSYERFVYKRRVFTSCHYTRSEGRINHMISTSNGDFMRITNLISVKSDSFEEKRYLVLGEKLTESDDKLCEFDGFDSNDFSAIARQSSQIVCCDFSTIEDKLEEYGCLSPTRRERAELKRKRDRESFTSGEDLDNSDGTRGDRGELEDEEYQPLSKKRKIIPQKANLTAYELELAAEILDRENNEDLNIAQPQSDQAIPASTPPYLSPRRSRSISRSRSPSRSISRSASRSPRRLTERSPSRSRPQSPSRSISQPAPRSPQSSPSRSRSRSPTQSPRSTPPQALSESSNFGDIEELRTRVSQLTKELERKDTKLAKLERKLQETLATLENAKSQLLARQSVQVSHSVSPLVVRRIPVLPQGRGETYPLPTEGYKLPSYCITNNTKLDPESFAAWILPLVFTAEELRSCSLYGIQIKTNNCPVKPALPEHRFNACLNENFRLFGDLPRFEARFGQGGRNVLPKNRVKK